MTLKELPTGTFINEEGDEFYLEASMSGHYHVYKVGGGFIGRLIKCSEGWTIDYSL